MTWSSSAAGPAGLSAAIRLKQLAAAASRELSVCILEKGSEVGAHILSGAVIDPDALNELIPDWKDKGSPLTVPVTENHHWVLSARGKCAIPEWLMPPFMNNKGTYTLSLGNFCRWLAGQAEELGVEIFPGFPAAELLFNDDGSVKGVATGDMGIARDGSHRADYQPGMELHARYTFFAEGARGHLTKRLTEIFDLRDESGPQVFGLGIKELWDIPAEKHKPGRVIHTQGWPLDRRVGRGLPLSSGEQPGRARLRRRARLLQSRICRRSRKCSGGRPIRRSAPRSRAAGACPMARGRSTRAAIRPFPKLVFPGGALIGCSAGFVNVPRIKGTHTAMKSAMLAAEAAFEAIAATARRHARRLSAALHKSWVVKELKTVRNAQPAVAHLGGTLERSTPASTCGSATRHRRAVDAQAQAGPHDARRKSRPRRSTTQSRTGC